VPGLGGNQLQQQREHYGKGRTFARFGIDLDHSPVLGDNLVTDSESQSRPFRFCREKGGENVFQLFFADAWSIVVYLYCHKT
jgi:hypothetical protein